MDVQQSKKQSADAYPVCEEPLRKRHAASEHNPTKKAPTPSEQVYQQGMHAFTSARALLRADVASGLNLQPSLFLFVPMLLASLSTTAFLEHYVVQSAVAHLSVFAVGSYVVFSTYFVCDFQMRRLCA